MSRPLEVDPPDQPLLYWKLVDPIEEKAMRKEIGRPEALSWAVLRSLENSQTRKIRDLILDNAIKTLKLEEALPSGSNSITYGLTEGDTVFTTSDGTVIRQASTYFYTINLEPERYIDALTQIIKKANQTIDDFELDYTHFPQLPR